MDLKVSFIATKRSTQVKDNCLRVNYETTYFPYMMFFE